MDAFVAEEIEKTQVALLVPPSERLKKVRDSLVFPLNTVCRLIRPRLVCSAVAIRPRILLTAGHNLIHLSGSRWVACPAYNDGTDFFPRIKVLAEVKHPRWASDFDPGFDIGLAVLASAVPATTAPVQWQASMQGAPVYVVGYGESNKRIQTFDTGAIVGKISNFLLHTCMTEPGHSGSPLFAYTDNQSFLVGIHAYPKDALQPVLPGDHSKGIRFTPEIYEWLSTVVGQVEAETGP